MQSLSELESAVLEAIAVQVPRHARELRKQLALATVIGRKNTGGGFYTRLAVGSSAPRIIGAVSQLGDIGAEVAGVRHGMGFLLWLRDGLADTLEAYTYGGSTEGFDLSALRASNVVPRRGMTPTHPVA